MPLAEPSRYLRIALCVWLPMGSTHILSLGSSVVGGEQPIAQYLRRIGGGLLRNANNHETKKESDSGAGWYNAGMRKNIKSA